MTLLLILREIQKHPILSKAFGLRGGTAINLFWFNLPRLSVDIDLNYIQHQSKAEMEQHRPVVEKDLQRLLESMTITVQHIPGSHAGGKWRLRNASSLGGQFTLELDLNYIMRIPILGTHLKPSFAPDPDYETEFPIVSMEELFAGKIKALMERAAPRDLYDVVSLATLQPAIDRKSLRKIILLFGLTCEKDWRAMKLETLDSIDQKSVDRELLPLLRSGERINAEHLRKAGVDFLTGLLVYDEKETEFLNKFYAKGEYLPELLFTDPVVAEKARKHPAVLWKLKNHRIFLGLESKQ